MRSNPRCNPVARPWLLAAALIMAPVALAQAPSVESALESTTATALELYRYRLLAAGTRLRLYPEAAVKQFLEGTAIVDLSVATDGSLKGLQLVRSSGHKLLDDAATATLERAVPLTEIPQALQNRIFSVRVVVVFKLPD